MYNDGMSISNQDITRVFYAKIPKNVLPPTPHCIARKLEIDACNSEKVKREKAFVWALLEFALETLYSLSPDDVVFTKTEQGKWLCENFHFSLSHSKNVVAVALSSAPVGIDVQTVLPTRESLAKKILSKDEFDNFLNLSVTEKDLFFTRVWTEKESAFKASNENNIFASNTNDDLSFTTKKLDIENDVYLLTVATQNKEVAFNEIEL